MNKTHIESSTSQIETESLPEILNKTEISTLQVFCETISSAGEATELQLLQRLELGHKKQLWAALSPQLRQALQALAANGGAA